MVFESKWAGESRFSLETAQEGVAVRIQKKQKKIKKNLTNAAEFSIMYIESERDDSPLGLEMRRNIDVQHFSTIASKGLKVIHMV